MRPYSMDLRSRVISARESGMGTSEIAETYEVSSSWIKKLLKRYRETGEMGPIAQRHGPVSKLVGHEEELKAIIEAKPDRTLKEIAEELSVKVCIQTVNVALQSLGYRHKKSL
jgi:transposase